MMVLDRATYDAAMTMASPGSPPGLTASKSSKSSSFHSISSDDNSVLSDVNHFEDIGLDDESSHRPYDRDTDIKTLPNPFSPSYSSDLRAASRQHKPPRIPGSRDASRTRPQRDITPIPRNQRPTLTTLQTYPRNFNNVRSTSTSSLYPDPLPLPLRSPRNRSPRSPALMRPTSPNHGMTLNPRDPNLLIKPCRGSWQSTLRERKSTVALEQECDEDEGDDIPEGIILDNVPISPRPPSERSASQPSSKATSPERPPKERVRSVGNGTPPVAVAQGSLRSPTWKADSMRPGSAGSMEVPALKGRAKSWTAALSDLSLEAKTLTEKLEEHADEMEHKAQQRSSTGSMPLPRRTSDPYEGRPKHKSALPELPPLRRTNIMIDPLPISKEKEAVLSRTRPSWLPPKDPAEEKRHLKEYQKMMAHSAETERRREAAKRARSECRDTAVDSMMQIWEHDILPRWNDAVRERRTRDLWWRGVAPRVRGAVWARAIGNELGLTEKSFQAALTRAHDVKARVNAGNGTAEDVRYTSWFEAIQKDIEGKTWKELRIFQAGAPLHQGLVDVLSAYALYRSDIGYVSGCNTIAALLLLNLPSPAATFVALANILNRPIPLSFFASDPGAKCSAYNLVLQTLSIKNSSLHDHIVGLPDHDPDWYLCHVFTALFTGNLALDQAARLWDVYVFEGDAVLVRAAVALLVKNEMALLGTKNVDEVHVALSRTTTTTTSQDNSQAVVARQGEEDAWMKSVREAGKA